MKPSRYLPQFERLRSLEKKPFKLFGDYLIIEKINEEEFKRKSGLVIPISARADQLNSVTAGRPHWARILLVGEGYYNDATGEDSPLTSKPGDIILVSSLAVRYFSVFGNLDHYEADTIGITKESEIQMVIDGDGGYGELFSCLNAEKEVEDSTEGA